MPRRQARPNHTHQLRASEEFATDDDPGGQYLAKGLGVGSYADAGVGALAATEALGAVGGGQAHNNMQPFLTLNFIIALVGTFPSRS